MEARGHHDSTPHVCPTHDLSENAADPLFGSTSFYTFDKILGGSCAAFVVIVVFLHLLSHAVRLSNPSEQLKIMRISFLLPVYSVVSFLSICFPSAKVYIFPWIEVFQAHSICAFFLLLCDYVSPLHEKREQYFAALVIPNKKDPSARVDGVAFLHKTWIRVMQYPVVAILVAILTDITQAAGVYCQYESKWYFAKLWISIIKNISLVLAVVSVLQFTLTLKPHLAQHNPMAKLVSFKMIVGLNFLQNILFWILGDTNVLNPTSVLTYADLNMGLPSLISCIEMVPICIFLGWAYSVRPYLIGGSVPADSAEAQSSPNYPRSYQGGFLGIWAFLAVLNPTEMIQAVGTAIALATGGSHGRDDEPDFYPLADEQRYEGQPQQQAYGGQRPQGYEQPQYQNGY